MKSFIKTALLLGLTVLVPPLRAQTDVDLDAEVGARLSLGVDKKLAKGLHLTLEEELRLDNNFGSFDRLQSTVALDYKLNRHLKVGLGYALINGYSASASAFKSARHRLMLDVKGTVNRGQWNFSLRERLQMTHRTGDFNTYQNPANAWMLKSRLMAKYKGFGRLAPFAAVELRHYLNAPVIVARYDGTNYLTESNSTTGDPGWFLDGFNGFYLNRVRGTLGLDLKLDKHHALTFCLMADRTDDRVVDANAEGTKLKSYTRERGFAGWLTAGYEFSF